MKKQNVFQTFQYLHSFLIFQYLYECILQNRTIKTNLRKIYTFMKMKKSILLLSQLCKIMYQLSSIGIIVVMK